MLYLIGLIKNSSYVVETSSKEIEALYFATELVHRIHDPQEKGKN